MDQRCIAHTVPAAQPNEIYSDGPLSAISNQLPLPPFSAAFGGGNPVESYLASDSGTNNSSGYHSNESMHYDSTPQNESCGIQCDCAALVLVPDVLANGLQVNKPAELKKTNKCALYKNGPMAHFEIKLSEKDSFHQYRYPANCGLRVKVKLAAVDGTEHPDLMLATETCRPTPSKAWFKSEARKAMCAETPEAALAIWDNIRKNKQIEYGELDSENYREITMDMSTEYDELNGTSVFKGTVSKTWVTETECGSYIFDLRKRNKIYVKLIMQANLVLPHDDNTTNNDYHQHPITAVSAEHVTETLLVVHANANKAQATSQSMPTSTHESVSQPVSTSRQSDQPTTSQINAPSNATTDMATILALYSRMSIEQKRQTRYRLIDADLCFANTQSSLLHANNPPDGDEDGNDDSPKDDDASDQDDNNGGSDDANGDEDKGASAKRPRLNPAAKRPRLATTQHHRSNTDAVKVGVCTIDDTASLYVNVGTDRSTQYYGKNVDEDDYWVIGDDVPEPPPLSSLPTYKNRQHNSKNKNEQPDSKTDMYGTLWMDYGSKIELSMKPLYQAVAHTEQEVECGSNSTSGYDDSIYENMSQYPTFNRSFPKGMYQSTEGIYGGYQQSDSKSPMATVTGLQLAAPGHKTTSLISKLAKAFKRKIHKSKAPSPNEADNKVCHPADCFKNSPEYIADYAPSNQFMYQCNDYPSMIHL